MQMGDADIGKRQLRKYRGRQANRDSSHRRQSWLVGGVTNILRVWGRGGRGSWGLPEISYCLYKTREYEMRPLYRVEREREQREETEGEGESER